MSDCDHRLVHASVFRTGALAGQVALWSCDFCGLRFYPACRTCVDVGHRGVDHPADSHGYTVVERLDRPGNRANGTATEPPGPLPDGRMRE